LDDLEKPRCKGLVFSFRAARQIPKHARAEIHFDEFTGGRFRSYAGTRRQDRQPGIDGISQTAPGYRFYDETDAKSFQTEEALDVRIALRKPSAANYDIAGLYAFRQFWIKARHGMRAQNL
jgi:hypothetical protein